MRRFLLTTAAVAGAALCLSGVANAQQAAFPAPPAGEAGPSFGVFGTTPQTASAAEAPGVAAPNSFVVHLNGRINWYAGMFSSSANQFNAGTPGHPLTSKLDPYGFVGYLRLYPGFNAVAANGLKYGVVGEIRMPGGGFVGPGMTAGSNDGANQTLWWHTAYGYVGSDQLGDFRFGMGPNATALWQGNFTTEGFNDGAWDGDVPSLLPSAAIPSFPFADDDPLWNGNKIVYLSPNFSGFQFGASFQPNNANLWDNANCSGAAGPTCTPLASTPFVGLVPNSARTRNMVDVAGMYNATFGGVGVGALATFVGSSHVNSSTPLAINYNGYAVGVFGLSVSFGGFTLAGNLNYGEMNGDWGMQPRGGVNEVAWMAGGQYSAGPVVVGASYFRNNFSGNWLPSTGVARTETDQGIAAGGTYSLVPGMGIYLSYLYGLKHQVGWNFNAGAPSALVAGGNNTRAQVIAIGTVLSW
ncbi:MAG: porin [Acetobacteraceae bacterium]